MTNGKDQGELAARYSSLTVCGLVSCVGVVQPGFFMNAGGREGKKWGTEIKGLLG